MDLGLIGSMARSGHELSSFVYTHLARMHLPTPIHKSRPLIGRNRKKRVTHGVSWKCKQSKTAADRRTGVLGDAGGGRGGEHWVFEVTGVALAMVSAAPKYWQPAAPLRKSTNLITQTNENESEHAHKNKVFMPPHPPPRYSSHQLPKPKTC